MFGSVTIEITIGLIVVFILVSTLCAAIREGIESVLKTRGAFLEQGIRQLLNDRDGKGLAKSVYEHPLVFGLFNGDYQPGTGFDNTSAFSTGKNLPSYIPSKNFARALMDIAVSGDIHESANAKGSAPVLSTDTIRQNVSNLNNIPVQRVLLNAVDLAQGDLGRAQANIENWFNSGMDRVSGWYKRSTQLIIFWIALLTSAGLNIDTINIINYLSTSDTARKILIKQAEKLDQQQAIGYEEAKTKLNELTLPIGWDAANYARIVDHSGHIIPVNLISTILGWLVTALAATLGAPYWFDILNRVMVIRSTVKPHEKSPEEPSQDGRSQSPKIEYFQKTLTDTDQAASSQIADDDIDGCDIPFENLTPDEDLPVSKGGTQT